MPNIQSFKFEAVKEHQKDSFDAWFAALQI